VLAILGAPGCGKTRLIEWMAERAHELGAASVLRATHGPIASPGDGLRPMLARAIGCDGLPWPAALARCSRFLDRGNRRDESVLSVDSTETNAASINDLKDRNNHTPAPNDTAAADRDERDALEAEALAALVADPQHTGDADPPIRFTRPRQRYRVARRLLARLSATRTLILWIDNAQWATDALAFVSDLLDADDLRVLVLASVREDALAAQPTAATLLADILARPRCRRLDIGALPPAEHAQLVEKLLGLAGDLAATVAARTAGNPLFAEQLIRDWVQRGVLIASANGFALEPGTSADIPDDIHALWAGKVARIAADSEDAVAALELAAALGHEVREDEWRQCCEVAGLALPSDMVERMLGARLVDPRPNGWSFTHAMLRESLDRAAREGGRFKNHHKTCAAALARLYPDGAADDRRGRHLLAAGVLEESLEPLLAGAEARRRAGDFVRAHVLYGDRTQALAALELPQTDARWGQTWVRQARAYATQGRADDAAQLAERAATAANRHGWPEVAAWAAMVRGYIELGRGEPRRAAAAFTDARDRFAALSADDSTGLADCLAGMGRVHMWLSELDEATRCYDAAYALHQASGDLYDLGITLRGLSGVAHCRGELAQARELLERARSCFEQSGSRPDVASCLNDLGELARSADDADEAAALYRRSAAMFEALGCDDASTPRYNLGLVQLASGDPDGAAAVFAAELGRLENGQRTIDALWLHAGLLPCAAASGDWARFDRELRAVQARLKGFVDEDLAWCTGHAGQAAAAAGQTARAQRALAIARDQWTRLDRPVELSAIEAAVAALDALDAPEP
jgi:tetratricopeptide (TPR) repeat protein